MQQYRITDGQAVSHVHEASPYLAICALTGTDPFAPGESIQLTQTGRPATAHDGGIPAVWTVQGREVRVEFVPQQMLQ